jgi:hypothetical protein
MEDIIKIQSHVLDMMACAMSLPLTRDQRQRVYDHLARGDRPLKVAEWVAELVNFNLFWLTYRRTRP